MLDKKLQHIEFEKANIPHLKLLRLEDAVYPYIIKDKSGSHGDSVYKIENRKDLDRVLKVNKAKDILVQEFLTSGFDLRVIVFKGSVLGIINRVEKLQN